jgi:hypothetical protein
VTDPALSSELAALRAELAGLREQLDGLHSREPTMRTRLRCPACSRTKIAHLTRILDGADFPKALALWQRWNSSDVLGELEAYACTGCGLVEWYANDPGRLTKHDGLEILEGPPEAGPYR